MQTNTNTRKAERREWLAIREETGVLLVGSSKSAHREINSIAALQNFGQVRLFPQTAVFGIFDGK